MTGQTYKIYGFQSLKEAKGRLTTGLAYAKSRVNVDALLAYEGGEVAGLFEPELQWLAAVKRRGQVRSSITFVASGGNWKLGRFGQPVTIQLLEKLRQRAAHKHRINRKELFVIEVPGLNRLFLAATPGGTLKMIPTIDLPQWGHKRMDMVDGRDLLVKLAAEATSLPRLRQ